LLLQAAVVIRTGLAIRECAVSVLQRGVFGAGVLGTGMRRMRGIDFFDETEKMIAGWQSGWPLASRRVVRRASSCASKPTPLVTETSDLALESGFTTLSNLSI